MDPPRSSTSMRLIPEECDKHIQTIDPKSSRILYKAKFQDNFYDDYDKGIPREYFYVLENGYEANSPSVCSFPLNYLCLACCCYCPCFTCEIEIFPNMFCRGDDKIEKSYFDRGAFDDDDLYHWFGLATGSTVTISKEVSCLCCCIEVPPCNCLYGERVSVVPCDKCLFCIPNYANSYTNCGNCCGRKTGDPFIAIELVNCLAPGEGANLKAEIDSARSAWKRRLESVPTA